MKILKAGLFAGLIGGALDILAAFIIYGAVYGAKPVRILQSITAGLQGPAAYQGGTASAAFGLALHFFIAFVAGLVLAVAMMRIDLLRRSTLATGAAFGVAMYFFMQMIVLPLSLAASSSPDMKGLAIGIAIHIFLFGLPMAFAARRVLRGS